jgi:hypothetical protein
LQENERLFGIKVQDLLTVDGEVKAPEEVYRKVHAGTLSVLAGSKGSAGGQVATKEKK